MRCCKSAQKKADVTEHGTAFHHVGLLSNKPPRQRRAALYLVVRQIQASLTNSRSSERHNPNSTEVQRSYHWRTWDGNHAFDFRQPTRAVGVTEIAASISSARTGLIGSGAVSNVCAMPNLRHFYASGSIYRRLAAWSRTSNTVSYSIICIRRGEFHPFRNKRLRRLSRSIKSTSHVFSRQRNSTQASGNRHRFANYGRRAFFCRPACPMLLGNRAKCWQN